MSTVVWALWVRGRIRTRIQLADGGDDALADLTLTTKRRQGGGHAIGRDGVRWDVETTWERVVVRRDGVTWFSAEGEQAEFAGRGLTWDRSDDSWRRASLSRPDGSVLLRVRPGTGRRAPFATFEADPQATDVLPVVLGVSYVLLEADAIYRSLPSGSSGGGP